MAERILFFDKLRTALAGLLLTSAVVPLCVRVGVAKSQPQAAPQTSSAEEGAGDAAVKQGQLREAFQHYMNAFENLPARTSLDSDKALREKIIKVVLQLNPPPAIPQDAIRHAAYAQAAVEEAGKSGDASDLNNAVSEIEKALRIAPWWAQAYFNLGEVLQKAQRPGEAAQALQLYLVADPHAALAQKNGTSAQDVQMEIYKLQYEAKRVANKLQCEANPSADVLFLSARHDFNTGKDDVSRREFRVYLRCYGDTDLASKAQFYLGEIDSRSASGREALQGVKVGNLTAEILRQLNLPSSTSGVVVESVDPSSTAGRAGVQQGEVISEVNQHRIDNVIQFDAQLKGASVNPILLLVIHGRNAEYVLIQPH